MHLQCSFKCFNKASVEIALFQSNRRQSIFIRTSLSPYKCLRYRYFPEGECTRNYATLHLTSYSYLAPQNIGCYISEGCAAAQSKTALSQKCPAALHKLRFGATQTYRVCSALSSRSTAKAAAIAQIKSNTEAKIKQHIHAIFQETQYHIPPCHSPWTTQINKIDIGLNKLVRRHIVIIQGRKRV